MAQFDVYKNAGGAHPMVVDVQSEALSKLASRIVVPVMRRDRYLAPLARATPVATIKGIDYVLLVPLLSAVSGSSLGKPIASVATNRADIIAAVDLVFTGS